MKNSLSYKISYSGYLCDSAGYLSLSTVFDGRKVPGS